MAESIRTKIPANTLLSVLSENSANVECAVCLQTSIHPAELPCGHIFCYLCIKGIVNQGRRCAMCRQDIPVDYLDRPRLLKPVDAETSSQGFEDGHLWFYEGHNGWWQYDERTSVELESAYQKGERCCELLIAGFLYIADFDAMLQYRRNDPSKRRRIKRDLATTTKKGVAGLKPTKECSMTSNSDVSSSDLIQNLPVPSGSLPNNIPSLRSLSLSNLTSAQTPTDSVQTNPISRQQNISESPHSDHTPISSNVPSQTEEGTFNSRNFDLDNIIHDTLDWTIEQIESLNLELLNDYEVLFRDFSNYARLQGNINQNRPRRGNNYLRDYLNFNNTSQSSDSQLETTRISTSSQQSNHDENNASNESSSSPVDINHSAGEVESDRTFPSPPPRIRGASSTRSRTSPRRSSSQS